MNPDMEFPSESPPIDKESLEAELKAHIESLDAKAESSPTMSAGRDFTILNDRAIKKLVEYMGNVGTTGLERDKRMGLYVTVGKIVEFLENAPLKDSFTIQASKLLKAVVMDGESEAGVDDRRKSPSYRNVYISCLTGLLHLENRTHLSQFDSEKFKGSELSSKAKMEGLKDKISDLNQQKMGVGQVVRHKSGTVYRWFRKLFRTELDLKIERGFKFSIHTSVQHMSFAKLTGNTSGQATQDAIIALEKMDPVANGQVIESLKFSLEIETQITKAQEGDPSEVAAKKKEIANTIRNKALSLEKGAFIAIPTGTFRHATMMKIQCTGVDARGNKTYEISQFNTGQGVKHHLSKEKKVQAYVIEDLTASDFTGNNFFEVALSVGMAVRGSDTSENIDRFYETLGKFEKLTRRGKRKTITPDSYWTNEQMGGSCTGASVMALIKSCVPPQQYEHIEIFLKTSFVFKFWEKIKKGFGTPTVKKTACLQAVNDLLKNPSVKGIPGLEETLKSTQTQLEAMAKTAKLSPAGSTVSQHLKNLLGILEHPDRVISEEDLEAFLNRDITSELKVPTEPDQIEKIFKQLDSIVEKFEQSSLTKEQWFLFGKYTDFMLKMSKKNRKGDKKFVDSKKERLTDCIVSIFSTSKKLRSQSP